MKAVASVIMQDNGEIRTIINARQITPAETCVLITNLEILKNKLISQYFKGTYKGGKTNFK